MTMIIKMTVLMMMMMMTMMMLTMMINDDECGDDDNDGNDVSSCWEFARESLLFTLSLSSCPGSDSHHYSNALTDYYHVQQSFLTKLSDLVKNNYFCHQSLRNFRQL